MKIRYFSIIFLMIFSFLLLAANASAASIKCSVCGKTIRGKYLRVDGKPVCSRSCYRKLLPKCATCGKPVNGGYRKDGKVYCSKRCLSAALPSCAVCGKKSSRGFRKDGKFYCSRECLAKSMPVCSVCGNHAVKGVYIGPSKSESKFFCMNCANLPKCYCCGLPDRCLTMKDGRKICRECNKTAIYDQAAAKKVFNEVRKRMRRELGLSTNNRIIFQIVDHDTLKKYSPKYTSGMEFGLYLYKSMYRETIRKDRYGRVKDRSSKITGETFKIYVLYGIPKKKLVEVIGHELGHDWMQEHLPNIDDLKLKEGWAEYVASEVNRIYRQSEMNKRMQQNPDKIYGDGYRRIADIARSGGHKGVINYLKVKNSSK